MRKLIILLSALVYVIHAQAQFSVTAHRGRMGQYPSTSTKTGIFLSAIRICQYGRGRCP
ncbi:hypothetical protein NIB75_17560 [Bacteroides uniformis]|nr:hypothetical protein [Bacteroides uniformis]